MRNTSETDYDVIKYNHYECSDGHFKQFSYASVLSCADHTYLRKNVWVICITLFHSSVSFDG